MRFQPPSESRHLISHDTLGKKCLPHIPVFNLVDQRMNNAEFYKVSSSEICQLTGGRNRSQVYSLQLSQKHYSYRRVGAGISECTALHKRTLQFDSSLTRCLYWEKRWCTTYDTFQMEKCKIINLHLINI